MNIPSDFIKFIESNSLMETSLCHDDALYIIFESIEGLEKLNRDLEFEKYVPGFYAFATDGGNELYAFDQNGSVFMLPMIGLSVQHAIKITENWKEFENLIKISANPQRPSAINNE